MRTCHLYDDANSEFIIKAKDGKLEVSADGLQFGDEYHTMHELYHHRMALNIALFNLIHQVSGWDSAGDLMFDQDYKVMKSKLHNDGTMFDGYFVVMLVSPAGQISYHYKMRHWDKFNIPEVERTPEWDQHNSFDVIERLMKL